MEEEDVCESPKKGALFQNNCSRCGKLSKYRCPKCSALSCSLECVKAHKEDQNCDGERDKTVFVPKEEFKDRHLMSDYSFIEDVGRTIDNAHRSQRKYGKLYNKLPHNLFRLQCAARMRKINLLILPLLFSKRKLSTTYLRYSDRKIFWRIEWVFPQCNVTCSDERVDELALLGQCLDKYLMPNDACDESLDYYQSFGHKGVSVLMKNEEKAKGIKYFVLNQNKSLVQNFKNKKIIEFPTLIVVPNMHLDCYVDYVTDNQCIPKSESESEDVK